MAAGAVTVITATAVISTTAVAVAAVAATGIGPAAVARTATPAGELSAGITLLATVAVS